MQNIQQSILDIKKNPEANYYYVSVITVIKSALIRRFAGRETFCTVSLERCTITILLQACH